MVTFAIKIVYKCESSSFLWMVISFQHNTALFSHAVHYYFYITQKPKFILSHVLYVKGTSGVFLLYLAPKVGSRCTSDPEQDREARIYKTLIKFIPNAWKTS